MAVKAEDLLAPKGELEADLFPAEVVKGDTSALLRRLQVYIEEAGSGATDEAIKAWAYHRAYKAVYIQMSANPTRASNEGQGSSQYHEEQALRFKELSDEWLAVFQGSAPVVRSSKLPGTQATRAEFTW